MMGFMISSFSSLCEYRHFSFENAVFLIIEIRDLEYNLNMPVFHGS